MNIEEFEELWEELKSEGTGKRLENIEEVEEHLDSI